ncbi:MATE family efflux transporter [Paraliobacillus sp. JSM ZJ581]|uniref:MATE family efflux transporter n=1 Tax=Paraliobacillus sp. JSM ZJ581 TaxID=3342118 RepID=UPI0035A946F9
MSSREFTLHQLDTQPIGRILIRYLLPSMIGMLLMAFNFVADGILVGNRLGANALAGVGISAPVYTLFLAISLWIGIGAATKYSMAMGSKKPEEARVIFTHAILAIFSITLIIGLIAFSFRDTLAYMLGANQDTFPYVSDYLFVILLFGFVFTIENTFSVFVRNDGAPNLAMASLIVGAVLNIVMNYVFLYILNFGVMGAASATIISAFVAILILSTHFFKNKSNLKLVRFHFNKKLLWGVIIIGFPSFLSEIGISVFTISHNIAFERVAGTSGVAAFSILNYTHSVMLMMFLGMGSAIQPLISYYHGANKEDRKRDTLRKSMFIAILAGFTFFIIGQLFAGQIVSIFGQFPNEVTVLAVQGIKLFFIAYLFTGINFVMMTYYQSVGNVRMATWITASREILIMLIFLVVLPPMIGTNGIWLAIPASEFVVLISILMYQRK